MAIQVQLAGRISVRCDKKLLPLAGMGGVLGRMILVHLSLTPHPISRNLLIDALWPDNSPPSTDSVLNATFSRLRKGFSAIGFDAKNLIISNGGSVEIRWPEETRIDLLTTTRAIDDAEAAYHKKDMALALRGATISYAISRNPILPGIDRIWLDSERTRQNQILERSLNILCDVWDFRNELDNSLLMAQTLLRVSPYSQQAIQKVVRTYLKMDDYPAAYVALTKYEELISTDLGIRDTKNLRAWFKEISV